MVSAVEAGRARPELGATRFADVRRFASIGSTNAWLVGQARQGAPEGLVAVADHQEAGRGRLGRTWSDRPGAALLVSVLLRPALSAERLHLASVVVALAAADACLDQAGVVPQLKWPNDLLLDSRKLAGVLAEGVVEGGQVRAVVVGLGLNLRWPEDPPPDMAAGGISLDQRVGWEVDRDRILTALLVALEPRYAALADEAGQAAQAGEYRRRCATLGQVVRIEMMDETFTGTVVDVTAEGHLLVDVGTCLRRVTAGDVVHLR